MSQPSGSEEGRESSKSDSKSDQLSMLMSYGVTESQDSDSVEGHETDDKSYYNEDTRQDCKPFFKLMENNTDSTCFNDIVMTPIEETGQNHQGH